MSIGPPESIFGIQRALPLAMARRLLTLLAELWSCQFGVAFGDLESDIARLAQFYDPVATGGRLRDAIAQVRPVADPGSYRESELWLEAGAGRFLITPEGRFMAAYLPDAIARSSEIVVVAESEAYGLEHGLRLLYRSWGQQRLKTVVLLLSGEGAAMLPQSIAAVLLLLVNRSTSRERRLPKLQSKGPEDALLDSALNGVMDAFAQELSPADNRSRKRSPQQYSFYSGYALTEARRRFGDRIVSTDEGVWIPEAGVPAVLEFIATDLARRPESDSQRALIAYDALVEAYERVRPELSARGLAFGRTADERRLRQALEAALAAAERRT